MKKILFFGLTFIIFNCSNNEIGRKQDEERSSIQSEFSNNEIGQKQDEERSSLQLAFSKNELGENVIHLLKALSQTMTYTDFKKYMFGGVTKLCQDSRIIHNDFKCDEENTKRVYKKIREAVLSSNINYKSIKLIDTKIQVITKDSNPQAKRYLGENQEILMAIVFFDDKNDSYICSANAFSFDSSVYYFLEFPGHTMSQTPILISSSKEATEVLMNY